MFSQCWKFSFLAPCATARYSPFLSFWEGGVVTSHRNPRAVPTVNETCMRCHYCSITPDLSLLWTVLTLNWWAQSINSMSSVRAMRLDFQTFTDRVSTPFISESGITHGSSLPSRRTGCPQKTDLVSIHRVLASHTAFSQVNAEIMMASTKYIFR